MVNEVIRERGISTPQINIQGVDSSEASVTEQVSTFALKTADVLADKANKKYELDFKNMAAEGIDAAYQRNQNNPDQLGKELKSLRGGLIKNAPWSLRDQFDASFSDASRPYMNKATDGYGKILTDQLQESSLKSLDLNKKALGHDMSDLMSNDPVRRLDAQKSMQLRIQDMSATATQTDATGQPIFSASQRFKMMQDTMNDTVFHGIRESYDNATDKQGFMNRLQNGDLKASIFLNEKGEFAEMPIKDGMEITMYERTLNYMEADIKSIKADAARADAKFQKDFMTDPFLIGGSDNVDINVANQIKQGVAIGNVRVMPNQQAEFMAHDLNGTIDSVQFQEKLAVIQAKYGAEHYDAAMDQIKKEGLSGTAAFVALVPPANKNIADAALLMSHSREEITKQATARQGVTIPKIEDAVSAELEDTKRALLAEIGDDAIAQTQKALVEVATVFASRGYDVNTSATMATSWFNKQHPTGDFNGQKYRIAKGFSPDQIESALTDAIYETKFQGGEFENKTARTSAQPVLDKEGLGYYLVDRDYYDIKDATGKSAYYPIADIWNKRKAKVAAINKKAAEDAYIHSLGD